MKSLLIQDFVDREWKHTFDKQFWLLETTVVIALNYGPTEKRKDQRAFLLWFIELLFFQIQHCVYQMEL